MVAWVNESVDERSARVLRAIEATVSGETSGVEELFTEDVTASTPTMAVGSRVELAVELEDDETCFGDVAIEPGPTVSSGDRVWTEWVASGIHAEPDPGSDRGPFAETEWRVTLRGVSVAEFEGERIRAVRHYWNEAVRPPDPTSRDDS